MKKYWSVIKWRGSWFARYTKDNILSDTGPFSTPDQARDWINEIKDV